MLLGVLVLVLVLVRWLKDERLLLPKKQNALTKNRVISCQSVLFIGS